MAAVSEYVRNSRAVLDSLNRYEFLKGRVSDLRTDLSRSQTANLGLKLQLVRANIRADSCNKAGVVQIRTDADLKAARKENWVWRGIAVLFALKTVADVVSLFK